MHAYSFYPTNTLKFLLRVISMCLIIIHVPMEFSPTIYISLNDSGFHLKKKPTVENKKRTYCLIRRKQAAFSSFSPRLETSICQFHFILQNYLCRLFQWREENSFSYRYIY